MDPRPEKPARAVEAFPPFPPEGQVMVRVGALPSLAPLLGLSTKLRQALTPHSLWWTCREGEGLGVHIVLRHPQPLGALLEEVAALFRQVPGVEGVEPALGPEAAPPTGTRSAGVVRVHLRRG